MIESGDGNTASNRLADKAKKVTYKMAHLARG